LRLGIVIPVLNEEKTLENQIGKLLTHLARNPFPGVDVEITIADNGSTDRTQNIAKFISKQNDAVRYHRVDEVGVGRALKAVWHSSSCEFVGYMDLDLATDLAHLRDALRLLTNGDADCVYATRWAKDSIVLNRSLKRTISSWVFNKLLAFYFDLPVSDAMCGFKFLRRDLFSQIEALGDSNPKWFYGAEIIVLSHHLGKRLVEIPVRWMDDRNSKVRILSLAVEYLGAMRTLKSKIATKDLC